MREADIQAEIMLAIGALDGVRVFRNHVGQGWHGKVLDEVKGRVILGQARRVSFGLCPGSADLIGWRSLVVTQAMVGHRVAIFLAPEVKTVSGAAAEHQKMFLAAVRKAGGLAGVVRSPESAMDLLSFPIAKN